jgi:hypothetical protein
MSTLHNSVAMFSLNVIHPGGIPTQVFCFELERCPLRLAKAPLSVPTDLPVPKSRAGSDLLSAGSGFTLRPWPGGRAQDLGCRLTPKTGPARALAFGLCSRSPSLLRPYQDHLKTKNAGALQIANNPIRLIGTKVNLILGSGTPRQKRLFG